MVRIEYVYAVAVTNPNSANAVPARHRSGQSRADAGCGIAVSIYELPLDSRGADTETNVTQILHVKLTIQAYTLGRPVRQRRSN